MDLQDYTPNTDDIVVTLKIKDKVLTNEDGSPMTITFYSPHSEESKAIKYKMIDARIEKVRQSDAEHLSAAEVDEINLDGLIKNTKEWNITWAKKTPKLTEKVAREVYSKITWIKGLYDAEVSKREVFTDA
jgi:hypothetical protein